MSKVWINHFQTPIENVDEGETSKRSLSFVVKGERMPSKSNPRWKNGNFRRKMRAKFKAVGYPCHLCGRPIHYDEPSDAKHPLSFVIDEIIPVSRYKEGGYLTPEECCRDVNNLAPAHYACNLKKSNHLPTDKIRVEKRINCLDGDW